MKRRRGRVPRPAAATTDGHQRMFKLAARAELTCCVGPDAVFVGLARDTPPDALNYCNNRLHVPYVYPTKHK